LALAIPAWLYIGAGWVIGNAVRAVGGSSVWVQVLSLVLVMTCWSPAFVRARCIPGTYAIGLGTVLLGTLMIVALVPGLARTELRLALELALTCPLTYALIDRPYSREK
jgi:hypothetical protein